MGHRQQVLSKRGYTVEYSMREKYRGCPDRGPSKICQVNTPFGKGFAVHCHDEHQKELAMRLKASQEVIPNIARVLEIVEDVAIYEYAPGELLWHLDDIPVNVDDLCSCLGKTVDKLAKLHIIHGDIRPWNVFISTTGNRRLSLVDWNLGVLVDKTDGSQINSHFSNRGHRGPPYGDIDREDLIRLRRVLMKEETPENAWNHPPQHFRVRPKWCC